ncbi:hypothetical protein Agub_g11964 [Astrephomene gubernaculifera]|uniref:Uncharacterized protein n=1 Tax=Astrephomene gubernaculifera TaxID=47775 RepID=A0AAD3DZ27_9CHLO|nr:hypothetical protein Agub_g11964 [Astrephomene gubernaculifera]
MSGLSDLPYVTPQHFLFLSFLAHDISQQGANVPSVLLASELASWVAAQGLSGEQANLTVSRLLGVTAATTAAEAAAADGGGGRDYAADEGSLVVTTKDWMQRLSATTSLSLLCPAYDPSLAWGEQPAVVTPGCYCNATRGAATFRCAAGSRCSRSAFRGLDSDAPMAPTAALLRALCVACEAGQYCGEGTYLQNESDLSSLDCPAGFYCPSPAQKLECPAGSFCSARSVSAITCNYESLLMSQPYQLLPLEPETVVRRLRDKRDPLRGNYCPAQSTKPYVVCSAGYYCPNVSAMLPCPRGYFCKAQSTSPWKCSWLSHCPEGTEVPRMSFMALLIAAIIVCGMPLIHLFLTHLDNSVIMDADEEGARGRDPHRAAACRMTKQLLKSIKLSHSPLENKYRGFRQVSPPITLEFETLGLQIHTRGGLGGEASKRVVLQGVSGSFSPRRLNAILGPSGCGKTTFLNVLCGKISTGVIMGQVRVNGEDMPVTRLKKITGFVPQDDIVHEDLTVRENLNYSARLRLPSDFTRSRRRDVVHDALEMLGLSAIQHYRVGTVERRGISGGQRKRVNIGLELVAVPSLLFLDEPTSGLDATSSADILTSLGDMANLGMNIIMVIHQPRFSSFLMFDQVLLLGTGGRTVYLGSPYAAMLYFTKYLGYRFPDRENPSDILMDIIAGKLPCAEDPKLKNCSQLVDKWTSGGMAWVETLETLNPTMVTKMSDVDPAIMLAIDEEFDMLDEDGKGQINSGQLVKLFDALGQDISVEDAIILIRKINANRPASAKPGTASNSTTGTLYAEDADGLTITKQQLLDAFHGVREGNGEAPGEGGAQRSAAAKFYASQFLLPDLPEVRDAREVEMTRRRRKARDPASTPRGSKMSQGSPIKTGGRNSPMGHRDMIILANSSAGGSSYSDSGDQFENGIDSYSPMRFHSPRIGHSPKGAGTGSGAGTMSGGGAGAGVSSGISGGGVGNPVVESVMRRGTLSPGRGGDVSNGNRTIRTVMPPPGMALANGTATNSSAAGTDESDGGAVSSGNLVAYAAKHRAANPRLAPVIGSNGGETGNEGGDGGANGHAGGVGRYRAGDEDELERVFGYHHEIEIAAGGGGHDGEEEGDEEGLSVAPGLVATSLAAMEALARADVPLPQLPRRVADSRTDSGRPCRSDRRSTTYSAIEAYVNTYNKMAATAATTGRTAAASSGGGGGGMSGGGGAKPASITHTSASAAAATARRASLKAARAVGSVTRRAGGSVIGEGDMWARKEPSTSSSAAAAGTPQHGVAAPARLVRRSGSSAGGDIGPATPSAAPPLPPLLIQLMGGGGGAAVVGRRSAAGPVAEGTETEADAAAADTADAADGMLSTFSMKAGAWSSAAAGNANDGRTMPMNIPLPPLPPPPLQPLWHHRKPLKHSASSPLQSDDEDSRSGGGAGGVSGSSPPQGSPPQHLGGVLISPNSGSHNHMHLGLATSAGGMGSFIQHNERRTPQSRLAVMTSAAPTASGGDPTAASPPAEPAPVFDHYYSDGGGRGSGGGAATRTLKSPMRHGFGMAATGSAERLLPIVVRGEAESSPLPKLDALGGGSQTGSGAGGSGGGSKPRRASLGGLSPAGHKQRRQSLLQASFNDLETSEGGSGTRKQKKDTIYVNNLLSNALVGAWAATQSVSTVRSAHSAARLTRPGAIGHTSSGGGASLPPGTSATAPGCLSSSPAHGGHSHLHVHGAQLSLTAKATMAGARGGAVARSLASMTALGLASKASSSMGGGLHGPLAARLAVEEALVARKSQGFFAQLAFLLRRGGVKYVRSFWPMRVVDALLQLAAAFVIGLVHGTHWGLSSVPSNAVMCMVCLGVLSCVTHLRTFSHNRVLLWRESASGMSVAAYYLAQNVIDQLWVLAAPALSLGVYYYLTLPRMPFNEFYVVGLLVCWWASGMAYLVSAVLPPQNVLMAGVFISLIFGAFLHGLSPTIASTRGGLLEGVLGFSYNRWAMEIVTISEMKHYQDDMRNVIIMTAKGIGLCGVDQLLVDDGNDEISAQEALSFLRVQENFSINYCDRYKSVAYGSLVALGFGFRLVAFIFMRYTCATRH